MYLSTLENLEVNDADKHYIMPESQLPGPRQKASQSLRFHGAANVNTNTDARFVAQPVAMP